MEEHHQVKHACKFCSKIFPCGRSLGGHMRSHLINTSSFDHPKNDHTNLPKKKKKLPHLSKPEFGFDLSLENPNKSLKTPKKSEEYTSVEDKISKQCGKPFQSWKALFGHMKCHSVNTKPVEEEDSWDTSINQSDNEAANPSRGTKKRSKVTKTPPANTNTSNPSPCVSEMIDHQQEEDEVALSLILLSKDTGKWDSIAVESSGAKKNDFENLKLDKKRANKRKKHIETNNSDYEKQSKLFSCIVCQKDFPSYQALGGHRASHKKFKSCCFAPKAENSPHTSSPIEEYGNKSKDHIHECSICFRVFSSGQALGGHKRSHLIADQAKSSSEIPSSVISVQKPIEEIKVCGFFDLNLPAPDEEEEEECSDFKNCWIGLLSAS